MFSHMISDLRYGKLPDNHLLRKRFEAALVKKMGVLQTPRSFWPADTKINPPAKQLLWAAILLQDKENYTVVEAIITTELEEKQRASGLPESRATLAAKARQLLQDYMNEFIELAPDDTFRNDLQSLTQSLTAA